MPDTMLAFNDFIFEYEVALHYLALLCSDEDALCAGKNIHELDSHKSRNLTNNTISYIKSYSIICVLCSLTT